MAVSLEGVSFTYPGAADGAGVRDVELTVGDGELLAVIGPSGSGKSTLLKLLAGFVAPDAGRVVVDGRDVSRVPPARRNLGIVFQSYALFPHMTAAQNVGYPLKVRGVPAAERAARAAAALAAVGLAGFDHRAPAALSGGQQQRVALARALVFEPRALLLDEPLSALDAGLRVEMRDEIRRVQRDAGIATLHVTHDQEEALSIADRVAVIMAGRLLQVDAPQTLYDRPVDRRVAAFVGQANLWPGRVAGEGRVDTPLGPMRCDTAAWPAGAAVTVLVRPESVVPVPASAAPNRFAGALRRDRFLGALRRYDLAPEGAAPDTVIQGETSLRGGLDAVSIPPEAIRLLPADDETTDQRGCPR